MPKFAQRLRVHGLKERDFEDWQDFIYKQLEDFEHVVLTVNTYNLSPAHLHSKSSNNGNNKNNSNSSQGIVAAATGSKEGNVKKRPVMCFG
jgi:hypothetical protein